MRTSILLFLLAFPGAAMAQEMVDVKEYRVDLDIDPATGSLDGQVVIRWFAKIAKLDVVSFDIENLEVTSARFGRQKTHFNVFGGRVKVFLETPVWEGGTFETEIHFKGKPSKALFSMARPGGGPALAARGRTNWARHLFPCLDDPADKAKFTVRVTVPPRYAAVSIGNLDKVEELGGGRRRFTWSTDDSIPTFAFGLAVAEYVKVEGEPTTRGEPALVAYVFPGHERQAEALLRKLAADLKSLSDLLGDYPLDGLTLAETGLPATLEAYGLLLLGEGGLAGGRSNLDGLARQWLGLTCSPPRWNQAWLLDGFAAYATAVQDAERRPAGSLEGAMARARRRLVAAADRRNKGKGAPSHGLPTLRGSWIAHMLRSALGPDRFRKFLSGLGRSCRGESVTVEQMQEQAERQMLRREKLGWLFDGYARRGGVPRFKITWCPTRTGIELDVDQEQAGKVFSGPLEVALIMRDGRRRLAVVDLAARRRQMYQVPVEQPPVMVIPDPYGQRLCSVESLPCDAPMHEIEPADGKTPAARADAAAPTPELEPEPKPEPPSKPEAVKPKPQPKPKVRPRPKTRPAVEPAPEPASVPVTPEATPAPTPATVAPAPKPEPKPEPAAPKPKTEPKPKADAEPKKSSDDAEKPASEAN